MTFHDEIEILMIVDDVCKFTKYVCSITAELIASGAEQQLIGDRDMYDTFTDLDLAGVPLPPGSILPLFAALGLVDINLVAKLALAPWDAAFARPRM